MNLVTKRFDESIKRASTTYVNPDSIRKIRNMLLAESDWTQMPDSPLSEENKQAWATYRQALRDMDLANPVWPQKPN